MKAAPVKEEPQPYIDCTGHLQVCFFANSYRSFYGCWVSCFWLSFGSISLDVHPPTKVYAKVCHSIHPFIFVVSFMVVLFPTYWLQVWRVNGSDKALLSTPDQSKFYTGDCYIFQYTYTGDDKEECLIGTWFGEKSVEV